ncbi:MAG TPA: ATP-binding cassette domain-containing protein [Polyangiaceae bacterium]
MNRLVLAELACTSLPPLSADIGQGLYAVLEPALDASQELIAVIAGRAAPTRGRVTLNGKTPFDHPDVRASIASVQAEEAPLPERTVLDAVTSTLALHPEASPARAVLERAGCAELCNERVERLSAREARSVALAIALAQPEPALIALHEPLATRVDPSVLRSALARAARRAVVIVTISRFEDSRALGGRVITVRPHGWREFSAARLGAHALRVRSDSAGELFTLLEGMPEILQVTRVGQKELLVHGEALEPLARIVAEQARRAGFALAGLCEQIDPYLLGSTPGLPHSGSQQVAIPADPKRPIYGAAERRR